MSDSFDVTTVVFAVIAIAVLFKLRSVLGSRTGSERPPSNPFEAPDKDSLKEGPRPNEGNVIQLPGAGAASRAKTNPESSPESQDSMLAPSARPGVNEIAKMDPGFTPDHFLSGARIAYETIVTAFAAGDREGLKNLLASDVYDGFFSEIAAREARGETLSTTFVAIEQATISDARVRDGQTQVTVRFVSKMITATLDQSGKAVSGNPDKVVDITDVWTFSRDPRSRDPNWRLIATEAGH